MSQRRRPQISTRKQPQQARSTELVAAILQAARQVLARHGVPRFTSARVADAAGVSVGSIYQYFPNKVAILFRLQCDEWQQTTELLRGLLEDRRMRPLARLREVVHAFIRSEREEAELRTALDAAAPLYRDAPEAQAIEVATQRTFAAFLAEVLPDATEAARTIASAVIQATLFAVGKELSEGSAAELRAHGDAMADMMCGYLRGLQRAGRAPRGTVRR